jgi:ribosomal protein S27AE
MHTQYPPANSGELLLRALRLRCPRCGQGKLFAGLFTMKVECPQCGLRYERAPGYFLGSIYINYGVTAVAITIGYLLLHVALGFTNRQLAGPLVGFCIVFAMFFFRYARALWLSFDCFFDPTSFDMSKR